MIKMMKFSRQKSALIRTLSVSLFSGSLLSCGVLIGSVKPVTEKAKSYRILELSDRDQDWVKLSSADQVTLKSNRSDEITENDDSEGLQQSTSDLAYQSSSTASIISINSGCRMGWKPEKSSENLKSLTDRLVLGFTQISSRSEKKLVVSQVPALETTLKGEIQGQQMILKAVVLVNNGCVYDLMYIAKPDSFFKQEQIFSLFVSSLKVDSP